MQALRISVALMCEGLKQKCAVSTISTGTFGESSVIPFQPHSSLEVANTVSLLTKQACCNSEEGK